MPVPEKGLDLELLERELIRDEGLRLEPYVDTAGKLTIGVGRNLSERGITQAEALTMLRNDVLEHCALLDIYLPWWRSLDPVRRRVLANMAFNLGVGPSRHDGKGKLLTFKRTLGAMRAGKYDAAADGMAASLWARQVGARASRLVYMMRTGKAWA